MCECEKAKLIRGDPPKISLKRRGNPQKSEFTEIITVAVTLSRVLGRMDFGYFNAKNHDKI